MVNIVTISQKNTCIKKDTNIYYARKNTFSRKPISATE